MDAQAMTLFDLTEYDLIGYLFSASAWLLAGALIGAFHFLTLRWDVRMLADGQSLLLPLGIQLVRFGLITIVLIAITRSFGALPLLVATAGVVITRMAIVRLGMQQ
jgi:F1F0 ATPase subunit 2